MESVALNNLLSSIGSKYGTIISIVVLIVIFFNAIGKKVDSYNDRQFINNIKIKSDKYINLITLVYTTIGVVNFMIAIYLTQSWIKHIPIINNSVFLWNSGPEHALAAAGLLSFITYLITMEIMLIILARFSINKRKGANTIKNHLRAFYIIASLLYVGIAFDQDLLNWCVVILFYSPMVHLTYKQTTEKKEPKTIILYMKNGTSSSHDFRDARENDKTIYVRERASGIVCKVTQYRLEEIAKKEYLY